MKAALSPKLGPFPSPLPPPPYNVASRGTLWAHWPNIDRGGGGGSGRGMVKLSKKAKCTMTFDQDCRLFWATSHTMWFHSNFYKERLQHYLWWSKLGLPAQLLHLQVENSGHPLSWGFVESSRSPSVVGVGSWVSWRGAGGGTTKELAELFSTWTGGPAESSLPPSGCCPPPGRASPSGWVCPAFPFLGGQKVVIMLRREANIYQFCYYQGHTVSCLQLKNRHNCLKTKYNWRALWERCMYRFPCDFSSCSESTEIRHADYDVTDCTIIIFANNLFHKNERSLEAARQ